ncbi:MAG TPA: autotransporter-associated beta strand repeat-containing protein [Fimbriiglobus sp.]|nr:autotransporter-associated beta strand repeat-containing protein [Fimbriiglobus sp.]
MRLPRLVRYCLALAPVLLAPPAAYGQGQLTWNFVYADVAAKTGYGFDDPIDGALRRETVSAAANYLSTILDGRGTITFNWQLSTSVGSPAALATAGTFISLPSGASPTLVVGDVYRQAMGNLSAGEEPGFGFVNFNLGPGFNWFAAGSGSGTPSASQYDLASVMRHELTHALHFGSAITFDGSSANGSGIYNRYDNFLYKSATGSDRLLNAANTAFNGVQSDLTNGSVYWGGEFAVAANSGARVKLYAPNPFVLGASLSHLDEAGATAGLMMSPAVNPGEVVRQYSGVEIGMLLDLGWNNYEWDNTTGSWSAGATGIAATKWRNSAITNIADTRVTAPVGEVTHNMVLTFGGSGGTAYTATNDLPAAAFKLNRLRLDSSASVTNAIAGKPLEMSNDNGFDVTPMIEQKNTGAFLITNNISIPKGLIVGGGGGGQVALTGALSGAGGLTKAGNFILVLSGANTYSGTTSVNAGTLAVTGQVGASPVTVAVGATLAGNGQLGTGTGGKLTVEAGGTVRPGDGSAIATLTLNSAADATFQAGSNLRIAVGNSPTASGLFRTLGAGNIDLTGLTTSTGGKLHVTLFAVETLQLGAAYTLTLLNAEGTGVMLYPTGGFDPNLFQVTTSGFTFDPSGYVLNGTTDVLTVTFVPVPEPATVLAIGVAGLGALGLVRRFRRRKADAVAV